MNPIFAQYAVTLGERFYAPSTWIFVLLLLAVWLGRCYYDRFGEPRSRYILGGLIAALVALAGLTAVYWSNRRSDALAAEEARSAALHRKQGIGLHKKGKLREAQDEFSRAIEIYRRLAKEGRGGELALANTLGNRGNVHSKLDDLGLAFADYDEAVQVYSRLMSHDEEGLPSGLNSDLAHAYSNRGTVQGRKGNFDKAIADYTQAISLSPNDAETHFNRSAAYMDKGDLEEAIADLTEVIRLDPKDAQAYFLRGKVYQARGEQAKAQADFEKAKELGYEPE